MSARLVALRGVDPSRTRPDLLDVPALLRRVAQDIDEGLHGVKEAREAYGDDAVIRAVLVLRVSDQEPAIFAMGTIGSTAQSFMDLHAGAQQLLSMESPVRG